MIDVTKGNEAAFPPPSKDGGLHAETFMKASVYIVEKVSGGVPALERFLIGWQRNFVMATTFFIPSRRITRKNAMAAFVNFGFFAVNQPRRHFLDSGDIDCEIRFHGAVRSLRSVANLSLRPFSITMHLEMENGENVETTVFDMKTFDEIVGKTWDIVKNLPIVLRRTGREYNATDSGEGR